MKYGSQVEGNTDFFFLSMLNESRCQIYHPFGFVVRILDPTLFRGIKLQLL